MPRKDNHFLAKDLLRIIKRHLEKEEVDLVWKILRKSKGCSVTVDDLIYMICANLPPAEATAFYDQLFRNPCGFNYGITPYAMLQVYDMVNDKPAFLRKILVEKMDGEWIDCLEKSDVDILINMMLADPASPSYYPAVNEVCKQFTFINDNLMLLSGIGAGILAIPIIFDLCVPFIPALAPYALSVNGWFASFGILIFAIAQAADHINQMFNWIFFPAFKCGDFGTATPHYILPPMPEMPSGFPLEGH